MVLVARGANGSSRQIGPAPAYNAGWLRTPEMVQGGDQALVGWGRYHVAELSPDRIAIY